MISKPVRNKIRLKMCIRDRPKTKEMISVLNNLKLKKTLVVLENNDRNVIKSVSNIPTAKCSTVGTLNTYEMLKYDSMLVTKAVSYTHLLITYFLPRYFPVFSGNSIVINANDEIAVKNINKMLYIYEQLKENYLWELDEEKLWEYAIKGMFEGTGDVYSGYMTADEYSAYAESVSGSYYGIGVRIQNNEDGNVQVVGVFSGSPAEEAGLMSGDVIVSAGDVSLLGVSVDNAVTYIKGEEGTSVTLGVLRNGAELTLEVRRAKIETEYTSYKMLDNGIGYIRIIEFETNAYKQFSEAVTSLKDMGMNCLLYTSRCV